MKCPKCGKRMKVRNTRPKGGEVRRYLVCAACKVKRRTIEKYG